MSYTQWSKADLRWYLAVQCKECRSPILFSRDYSVGTEEGWTTVPWRLVLTCTAEECRHQADYSADAVLRVQKTPGTNTSRQYT